MKKRVMVAVECMECGRKFTSATTNFPECPNCHGTDIDLDYTGGRVTCPKCWVNYDSHRGHVCVPRVTP